MAKKKISKTGTQTFADVFNGFVTAKLASGISEVTAGNYRRELKCISKYFDIDMPFDVVTKKDLEQLIVAMRQSELAYNTVATYARILKTFYSWCRKEGLSDIQLPNMAEKETVKETYSDEELEKLLKRPDKNAGFCDYRNWVIVNFLMNSGCRASTVRNIKNKDVDLSAKLITFRHNKNSKIQVIPLCSYMVNILNEYMSIRGGTSEEFLFCDQYGQMLTQNALRLAIVRYNRGRGVERTSIHLFRHTFARKYLVECGGDAFSLQKLLGHSTLNMTRHYCRIYDSDIANKFDELSPLAQMKKTAEKVKVAR